MISFIAWDESFPLPPGQLLITPSQEDSLREYINAGIEVGHEFCEIYVVSDGVESAVNVANAIFKLGADEGEPSSLLASYINVVCRAFECCDVELPEMLILERHLFATEPHIAGLGAAFEITRSCYSELLSIYTSTAPFELNISNTRRGPWWMTRPEIVPYIDRRVLRLGAELSTRPQLEIVHQKFVDISRTLSNLEVNRDRWLPFVTASAFAFVCAEVWLNRRVHNVALLMLNRAIEWALAAVAIDENIVKLGTTELQFVNESERAVGANSLLKVLANDGILSQNETRDLIFASVNTTRNQLAFTHGLGGVRSVELVALFEQVRVLIRDIEPKFGWFATVRKLRPHIVLNREEVVKLLGVDVLFRRLKVG
jgi:hypothetical protein